MSNEENLIPISEKTPEELREMTRNGGIKSGEVRREKKALREVLRAILEEKYEGELTYKEALMKKYVAKGLDGDVRALEGIIENSDGKLEQTINNKGAVILNFDKRLEKA